MKSKEEIKKDPNYYVVDCSFVYRKNLEKRQVDAETLIKLLDYFKGVDNDDN